MLQYSMRITTHARHIGDDGKHRSHVGHQFISAQTEQHAEAMADALDKAGSNHFKEHGTECHVTYDVVGMVYDGRNRLVYLDRDTLDQIAERYTNPNMVHCPRPR